VIARLPSRPTRSRRPSGRSARSAGTFSYEVVIVATVLAVAPLYWTLVAASRSDADISRTPPPFAPGGDLIHNIGDFAVACSRFTGSELQRDGAKPAGGARNVSSNELLDHLGGSHERVEALRSHSRMTG